MIKALTLLGVLLLGLPVAAQAVSERGVELLKLVAANNCAIAGPTDDVFIAGGFESSSELMRLFSELEALGLLQIGLDEVSMDLGVCAQVRNEVLPGQNAGGQETLSEDRIAAFVAVFQAHDCVLATRGEGAITQDELMALFAEAGFVGRDVPTYATALIESGRATVDKAIDAVTILPPLCGEAME